MTVFLNGKPIDAVVEDKFDRHQHERAAAMKKRHEEWRIEERGPSHSGLNQHWKSPRSWKHNRTMRP